MTRKILYISILIFIFIFGTPCYANQISPNLIEKYNIKIAKKFSRTYCNTKQFGISDEGALKFAIGETNKEFSSNKFNKFIDYDSISEKILINLKNDCQIYDFPSEQLSKLTFK
tara:strand:- start:297 stop:638 length:342 start_codon:yes stop_codon:yes gene_type:complete